MQENTTLELQLELQKFIHSIPFQAIHSPISIHTHDYSTQESSNQEEVIEVSLQPYMIKTYCNQVNLMAELQTDNLIILAFQIIVENKSSVSILLINKEIGKTREVNFKPLEVSICSMALKVNRFCEIQLIVGTTCGRLFVYQNISTFQTCVSGFRIQASPIVCIQSMSLQNIILVMTESNSIYLFDINEHIIKHQYKCLVPTIKNAQSKLLIKQNNQNVFCCFNYGLIFVWNIADQIKQISSLNNQIQKQNFDEKKVIQSSKMAKKQGKDVVRKNVSLKPKSSLVSGFLQGIFWIDFFGQFLIALTLGGYLKVIAVSFGQYGCNNMLQTLISETKVSETFYSGVKQTKKLNVIGVQKLNFNQIFISKSMESTRKSMIEQYEITYSYKIVKKRVINLQISLVLRQIRLSNHFQFIYCGNSHNLSILKLSERQSNRKLFKSRKQRR